jgi:hypothetical protein
MATTAAGEFGVISHVQEHGSMWVALEVNIALWGMILCALQTAQNFY